MLIISRGLRVSGLASFTLSTDSFGYLCYFHQDYYLFTII